MQKVTAPWLARPAPPSLEDLVDHFDLFGYTCCTVANRAGVEVPFIENAMQRRANALEDAMRAETGSAWLYQLKMRRGGLSLNTQMRNLWRTWRKPHTRGITLAHEDESMKEIFQLTRLAMLRFPPELLPVVGRSRERAVDFPEMGSRFLTGTAGTVGLGRGSDYSFLHVSEFAFVRDPRALHTSASQALRSDGTYIVETTASAFGSEAHEMYEDAKAGRSKFRPVFFPWWWRDDSYNALLDPNELDPLSDEERHIMSPMLEFQLDTLAPMMGRRPDGSLALSRVMEQFKWRREKIREIGPVDFNREYPADDASCWLVSGTPYFDTEALQRATQIDVREPMRTDWNGELRIYAEPDMNRRYLLGADPSEGVEGDRSAFTILDAESFDQVAAFSSRTVPPEQLADRANVIGRQYASAKYGEAVIVPEINAAGHTMIYQLLRVIRYPTSRIWHDTRQAKAERTSTPGWRTDGANKYIALDEGAQLIRELPGILHDRETVKDLLSVQRGRSGTVEMTGKDLAMAWLLAYQGRKHPVVAAEQTRAMGPASTSGALARAQY